MKKGSIDFYKYFLIFYVMSVFGFILETFWAYYRHGKIMLKTALVFECFIPIYGLGAIILLIILNKVKSKNVLLLFSISAVTGALFESFCSLFQEIFLNTRSWNYSGKFMPFFGGRTCLKYTLFWGLIGVLWIKCLYPFLDKIYKKINNKHLKIVSIILLIIVTFDITLSWCASNRMVQRHHNIEANNKLNDLLDKYFDDEYLKNRLKNIKVVSK